MSPGEVGHIHRKGSDSFTVIEPPRSFWSRLCCWVSPVKKTKSCSDVDTLLAQDDCKRGEYKRIKAESLGAGANKLGSMASVVTDASKGSFSSCDYTSLVDADPKKRFQINIEKISKILSENGPTHSIKLSRIAPNIRVSVCSDLENSRLTNCITFSSAEIEGGCESGDNLLSRLKTHLEKNISGVKIDIEKSHSSHV